MRVADAVGLPRCVTPGRLTDWLAAASAIAPDDRVVAIDCERIAEAAGEMCVVLRCGLSYASAARSTGPPSVIVKAQSPTESARRIAEGLGLYRRESMFYRHLADRVSARVPRAYHVAADDDGARCVLVLEDLPDHRPGDDVMGCSPHDAILVIDQLAKLHAPYWGRASGIDARDLPPHDGEHGLAIQRIVDAGWDRMSEQYGEILGPEVLAARDRFKAALGGLQRWLTAEPATLVHGDVRLDNLLFSQAGAEDAVVLIDWQGCLRAKGVQDVAYLISHTMNPEDRAAHEDELLARYCAALSALGVEYPLHRCREDYRYAVLCMFSYAVGICGAVENPHPRNAARKRALMRRTATALSQLRCISLLDAPLS